MNKQYFDAIFNGLTDRRKEVLLKLLANQTDAVIAKSLNIAKSTVRKHRQEICEEFGLKNEFPDERHSKLRELISLFAKYKPELLGNSCLVSLETSHSPTSLQPEELDQNKTVSRKIDFLGREEAISDLKNLVSEGKKIIGIYAKGGVGKTELARHFFQEQGFQGSQLWTIDIPIQTQKISTVEKIIMNWLDPKGEQQPEPDFQIMLQHLKSKLQTQRIGVWIDNLEPALNGKGQFIEKHQSYIELLRVLADPKAPSITLITSREPLNESKVTVEAYNLKPLDEAVWQYFFNSHNINTSSLAFREMYKAYGGNAKAMAILCGVIRNNPYEGDLEAYWEENKSDLLIERELEHLVSTQFTRLEQTDPDAYKLLCRLGIYRYQEIPAVPRIALLCLLWDVSEEKRKRVVKSLQDRFLIEAQKGGYWSFEYWLHPVIREEAINRIKLSEESRDYILLSMKKEIDKILASNHELQFFLNWVNQKSLSVYKELNNLYNQALIRSFYFEIGFPFTHYQNKLPRKLGFVGQYLKNSLGLDKALVSIYSMALSVGNLEEIDQIDFARIFEVNVCANASEPGLKEFLQEMRNCLPDAKTNPDAYRKWWVINRVNWRNRLIVVIYCRNLIYGLYGRGFLEKQFSEQQQELLKQYHETNLLLVDCLENASSKVKSFIENTLLLPIAELKNSSL